MRFDEITHMVGNTPCVRFVSQETGKANLFVKLEGYNPTGAVKDRACLSIIKTMLEQGKLQPGMTLLDASSGNFATSVAYFGKILGYPTEVVVSSKLTQDKRNFIEYFGGKIRQMGNFTIEGNKYCHQLVEQDSSNHYCFLDQLHNWANPQAHYETTGAELLADFPNLTMVVGSLGSGGTMFGTGKYLKEKKSDVKIVVVQAASGTKIPGTGSFDDGDYITPFIQKGLDDKVFDTLSKINLQSAIQRTMELREKGIFCGIQTGGVLHAALEQIMQDRIEGNVIIISGDSGWKNLDKLLSI